MDEAKDSLTRSTIFLDSARLRTVSWTAIMHEHHHGCTYRWSQLQTSEAAEAMFDQRRV
jgi:hypothetical protein